MLTRVIWTHDCQLGALVAQMKSNDGRSEHFWSILDRFGPARDAIEIIMELGKPLSRVSYCCSIRRPLSQ